MPEEYLDFFQIVSAFLLLSQYQQPFPHLLLAVSINFTKLFSLSNILHVFLRDFAWECRSAMNSMLIEKHCETNMKIPKFLSP